MSEHEPDTDQLLHDAGRGDEDARSSLLQRHRQRLREMVAIHLDRRLSARIDPSDVVQEILLEAHQKLEEYVRERPLPFYPWLRQLAKDRLIEIHRRHVQAEQRSVSRERPMALELSDESVHQLCRHLVARGSSPSARLGREETREQVRAALALLSEQDREVLVLRHLERLSIGEIAAVLGVKEGAVYARNWRALERLGKLLGKPEGDES